ncbi:unnamed protein product [Heterobilharzia americana]|nr:unnamed protein product [Heterobilharzia americana]
MYDEQSVLSCDILQRRMFLACQSSSTVDSGIEHPPPIPPKPTKDIPPLPPKHTSRLVRTVRSRCSKCDSAINVQSFHSASRRSDVAENCAVCKHNLESSRSCVLLVSKNIPDPKITQSVTCKRFTKRHPCQMTSKRRTPDFCEPVRDSNSTSDLPTSSCTCASNAWGPSSLGTKIDSDYVSHTRCFSPDYRGLNLIPDHFVNRRIPRYRDLGNVNKTGCGSLQWISDTFQRIFLTPKSSKPTRAHFHHPPNDMMSVSKCASSSTEEKLSGRVKALIQRKEREWKKDPYNQKAIRSLSLRHKRSFSYNSPCVEGNKTTSSNPNGYESSSTLNSPVNHHSLPPRSTNSRNSITRCNAVISPDATKRHFERLDSMCPSNGRAKPINVSKALGGSQTRYETPKPSNVCISHKRPESALAMMCACPPYVPSQVNSRDSTRECLPYMGSHSTTKVPVCSCLIHKTRRCYLSSPNCTSTSKPTNNEREQSTAEVTISKLTKRVHQLAADNVLLATERTGDLNRDTANPVASRVSCEIPIDPNNNVLTCTEDMDFGARATTIIDKNGQIHHVHHIHHFHHVHHHHHHHDCTDGIANTVASCPLSPVTSPVVCDRQRPPTTIASAVDTCILEETVSSPISCQNLTNQPTVGAEQVTPASSCHTYNAYDVRASDSTNISVSANSASRTSHTVSSQRLSSALQDSRSSFHRSMLELRKMGWYWGPLSFQEAQFLLAKRPDGSFLVRDSGHDTHILSLSFRVRGETYHTRIEHNQGRFSFWSQPQSHSANTMVEFIEKAVAHSVNGQFHYFLQSSAHGQPPVEVPLLYPLSRFQIGAMSVCLLVAD